MTPAAGRTNRRGGAGAGPHPPAQIRRGRRSASIVLDREVDVSRGDWLLAPNTFTPSRRYRHHRLDGRQAAGHEARVLGAARPSRWVKAKVKRIVHKLDVNTLAEEDASELPPNAISHVALSLQGPLVTLPYVRSRILGLARWCWWIPHRTKHSGATLVLCDYFKR